MNKLFNFAQAKGKCHKLPSFNLGGGAKLYKNFAQKLLAVSLCMAVVLLGVPVTSFATVVTKSTTLSVEVSFEGKEATIECTLTDEEGTALDGKEVNVTVTGPADFETVEDVVFTGDSGLATLGPSGSYTISASFDGDDGYDGSEASTDFYLWGITLKDENGTAIEADSTIYRAVEVGDKLKFSAAVDSGGAPNKGVTWSVDDEDIATIGAATGELTVKAIGEVLVKATSQDDPSVSAEFRLDLRERLDVNGLRILDWTGKDVTGGSVTLAVSRGVTADLDPAFGPDFAVADSSRVDFTGDNDSVATVSSEGGLTVKDYGTVTVTATSLDDPSKSATVTVHVSPPSTAVSDRDEPHSVALLTLTATGKTGEVRDKLTADMTWKTFIPGTTVDLELKFVMPDGSVAGQVNLMDWVATYGDMAHTAPGFVDLAPYDWCLAAAGGAEARARLDLVAATGDGGELGVFLSAWDGSFTVGPAFPVVAAARDFVPPLGFNVDLAIPGRARLASGSSVPFPAAAWFTGSIYLYLSVASSDPSVAVWEDGYIKGLSEGTATLTFMNKDRVLNTVEVAVGDWVPPHEVPAGLTAVAGTRLGDVALPEPTSDGAWEWVHPDDLLTTPGTTTHKALYTPTDTENYGSVVVDVPVEVYLEQTVSVKGKTQRLRVYNPNNVLPDGTIFEALAVTEHEHLDDDHEIEHLLAYDLSLLDASGNPLHMPLDAPVELCFEVLDGLDKNELEVVLAQQFDDREFDEELIVLEGSTWVKVKTDHFSPYALIDRLSAEEKAALDRGNIQTGDLATQITVAGLGMTLVLALGVMLRLITSKRKFEE